jgi:hypothetical protein
VFVHCFNERDYQEFDKLSVFKFVKHSVPTKIKIEIKTAILPTPARGDIHNLASRVIMPIKGISQIQSVVQPNKRLPFLWYNMLELKFHLYTILKNK